MAFKVDIFSMKMYMFVMDIVNDITYSQKLIHNTYMWS